VFTEQTHTVFLSLHGAGILSLNKLLAQQELTLRSLESNCEAEIRVVGEIGSQGKIQAYGVAFLDEQLDFWQVIFPPPLSLEEAPQPLALECSDCHAPITIEHGDMSLMFARFTAAWCATANSAPSLLSGRFLQRPARL
jgi:hypothetical protein